MNGRPINPQVFDTMGARIRCTVALLVLAAATFAEAGWIIWSAGQ